MQENASYRMVSPFASRTRRIITDRSSSTPASGPFETRDSVSRLSMRISVLTEIAPRERRVALAPDSVSRLIKLGLDVAIQRNAGLATLASGTMPTRRRGPRSRMTPQAPPPGATVVAKVQPPTADEIALIPQGRHGHFAHAPGTVRRPGEAACGARHHGARSGARSPHYARAIDGRPFLAGHRGRVQSGAARGRSIAKVPTDVDDGGRKHLARKGLRHWCWRRGSPGHRHGAPVGRRHLRLRRPACRPRAGPEPRRNVRRERDRDRGGRDGGRLCQRAELG